MNQIQCVIINVYCYIIICGVIHQVPDSSWRWRGSYTAPPPCLSHHPAFLSVRWWPPDPSSHPRRSSSGALRVKDRTDVRSEWAIHSRIWEDTLRRYTLYILYSELALTCRHENCATRNLLQRYGAVESFRHLFKNAVKWGCCQK